MNSDIKFDMNTAVNLENVSAVCRPSKLGRAGGMRQPVGRVEPIEAALLNVMLFLCFLPYVGLGPLATLSQVQPWAAFVAWMVCLYKLAQGRFRVSAIHLILLAFSIYFLLYVYNAGKFDISVYIKRSAVFLFSSGIMLASLYVSLGRIFSVLRPVTVIWAAFAALRYISPNIYFSVVPFFVPTVINSENRGSSSLAPEATDMGFTLSFIFLILIVIYKAAARYGVKLSRWPAALALVTVLLSKSGTGVFTLVLITIMWLLSTGRRSALRSVLVMIFTPALGFLLYELLLALPETGVRGVDLLTTLARSPGDLVDSTISYRVAHNIVGALGLYDSWGLGFGAGSFLIEAPRIYDLYNVGSMIGLTGYYAMNVPETLSQSPISFFAVIFLEFGVLGVAYIIVMFTSAAQSTIPLRAACLTMLFLAWAQSFPAAWPPFWVLLGVMLQPRRRNGPASHE